MRLTSLSLRTTSFRQITATVNSGYSPSELSLLTHISDAQVRTQTKIAEKFLLSLLIDKATKITLTDDSVEYELPGNKCFEKKFHPAVLSNLESIFKQNPNIFIQK